MDKNALAGHFRLRPLTKELFIVGMAGDIPVLTLQKPPGGPLGIDSAAVQNSGNLITSGAVFKALAALTPEPFEKGVTIWQENCKSSVV